MGRVAPWILAAMAVGITVYAWVRVASFSAVTGPQRVQWYGSDGTPLSTTGIGEQLGNALAEELILGDRLIVPAHAKEGREGGFAWISPARGEARIAWPYPDTLSIAGIAARDPSTFAVVLRTFEAERRVVQFVLGIAGRDGWLRRPVVIAEWAEGTPATGAVILLGMSFVGADVEAVLTHPRGEDVFGAISPADIVRVGATGAPAVRSVPVGCAPRCFLKGALPAPKGWTLLAVSTVESRYVMMAIDETGTAREAPPAVQWWADHESRDATALGTWWGASGWGENRVERDGSRGADPVPPFPGWRALAAFSRTQLVEGVLRRERLFGESPSEMELVAQRVGTRTIVTRSVDDDLQLVGPSPTALVPTIFNTTSYHFQIGTFLPRSEGGFYWVTGQGEYVTLDDELRRIDPLPLRHHLRTRGSVGDFIDEPEHERYLGWALFGLPILLLGALATARLTNITSVRSALGIASGLFVLTGAGCLLKVLPLL